MTDIAYPEVFGSLADLEAATGRTIGPGRAERVTQERIQLFADATDDHQWIHVDEGRAAAGPYGITIAHGYLTLSLIPHFLSELVEVQSAGMGVNYGLNKVRFPAPVPRDSELRATITIGEVVRGNSGGRVSLDVTVEADGARRPVCVAQVLVLYAS